MRVRQGAFVISCLGNADICKTQRPILLQSGVRWIYGIIHLNVRLIDSSRFINICDTHISSSVCIAIAYGNILAVTDNVLYGELKTSKGIGKVPSDIMQWISFSKALQFNRFVDHNLRTWSGKHEVWKSLNSTTWYKIYPYCGSTSNHVLCSPSISSKRAVEFIPAGFVALSV